MAGAKVSHDFLSLELAVDAEQPHAENVCRPWPGDNVGDAGFVFESSEYDARSGAAVLVGDN